MSDRTPASYAFGARAGCPPLTPRAGQRLADGSALGIPFTPGFAVPPNYPPRNALIASPASARAIGAESYNFPISSPPLLGSRLSSLLTSYPLVLANLAITLTTLLGFVIFDRTCYSNTTDYWPNPSGFGRCEDTLGHDHHFLREKCNALSSLVFGHVGVYCILAGLYDFRRFRTRGSLHSGAAGGLAVRPLLSLSYGVGVCLAGYGAFLYHASAGSPLGEHEDIWSIFVICNGVVMVIFYTFASLAMRRLGTNTNQALAAACVAGCAYANYYCYDWYDHFWLVVGSWDEMYSLFMMFMGGVTGSFLLLIPTLYALGAKHRVLPFVPLAVACVALAVYVWAPEELEGECALAGSGHSFQLHACWHALLAITLLWIYCYARSVGVDKEELGEGGEIGFYMLREEK